MSQTLADKRRVQAMPTVAEAAAQVLAQKRPGWRSAKHAHQWWSTLTRFAFPDLGPLPVGEVTSADVLQTLQRLWHVQPDTARRVRQRLSAVMEWAIAMKYRAENPCDRLSPVLGPQQAHVRHMRAAPPSARWRWRSPPCGPRRPGPSSSWCSSFSCSHASVMFAPNVVGSASAITAGWGNLGWRIAMVVPGVAMLLMATAYFVLTQDTPFGNFAKLRAEGRKPPVSDVKGTLRQAAGDYRVWVLFLAYAACFGVELTIYNIAAIYYHDQFGLSVAGGGVIVGLFGLTNLFARALGGITGDKVWLRFGLRGRMVFLGAILLLEGAALLLFAKMSTLALSIAALVLFGVFVQMSEGATYSVVPFINRRALGSASGIVGAGGNAGGFGFLFRAERIHAAFRIVLNALRRH